MSCFIYFVSIILASSALFISTTKSVENDNKIIFPKQFVLRYLKIRSIRRAVLLTASRNGAFQFELKEMKNIIRDASYNFIHFNVLFLEELKNSTGIEYQQLLNGVLSVMNGPLIIFIYDNSTEADSYLIKAGLDYQFRAQYKWLILTNDIFYDNLRILLSDIDVNVDSDLIAGVVSDSGNIELQEIYVLGKIIYETPAGIWQVHNFTCTEAERENVCQNISIKVPDKLILYDRSSKLFERANLNGYQLRIVSVNVSSFYTIVKMDPESKSLKVSGGYFGEVFKILTKAMNFTYTMNLLEGYAYGVILSTSSGVPQWSGLVGEIQNKRADMTGCEVSYMSEREPFIDYTMPLQIISRHLYIHRPMRSGVGTGGGSKSETTWYKGGGFVRPFALHVWFCVTGSLLLFLAASRLHAYYTFPRQQHNNVTVSKTKLSKAADKNIPQTEPSGPPTLVSDLFRFVATLVQQGLPDDPDPDESRGEVNSTQSRRLILWTASVTYLIVYTSYGAKLASILASESEPRPPFENLEGLYESPNWKLGMVEKALDRVAFESSDPKSLFGRLWSEKIKKSPDVLVPDIITGLRKVLEGQYAFLGFDTGIQAVLVQSLRSKEPDESLLTTSEVCRLMDLPNDYLKGGIAFGLQEQSPYRPIVQNWLLAIRSFGILDRLSKVWLPEALPCLEDQTVATVGLIDIAPALSALGFGIMMSIALLLLEVLYDLRFNRPDFINTLPFHQ